jgi:hypothetical protein
MIQVMKIKAHPPEIEKRMRDFYNSLSEKNRRRHAAVEATKSGHGGITYICHVLQCDEGTVVRGMKEVKKPLSDKEKNIRKAGGGRKSVLSATDGPDDAFSEVLRNHTAGSPMDDTIKQTNSSRGKIAGQLTKQGFSIRVTATSNSFCNLIRDNQ